MNSNPVYHVHFRYTKCYVADLIQLFLLTSLLISPFIIVPYFTPVQSSTTQPVIINSGMLNDSQSQSPQPRESQFGLLIKQSPPPKKAKVLGAKTPQETSEEKKLQNKPPQPPRSSYTIAVLGDSMIDVMQPELPQLKSALQKFYPQTKFKLLNYGVGASDIEYGLKRLTSSYTYLGQGLPALLSQNPDIIVVESFAYNHWGNSQSDLDRQWLTIAKIIETIKNHTQAKVILAATIGPDEATLCDGIEGFSLTPVQKWEKAQAIRAYLQNLVNFATSQGYPLADAYHASLDVNGNGKAIYVNAGDHLHPSGPGGELLAQKIAKAIYTNKLL